MSESETAVSASVAFEEWPPITQEQLRDFAQASGDLNPIHLDADVARAAGLPGVIAHGMLLASFIGERALRYAKEEAGLPGARVMRIQTRFRAMVLLGDVISIGGSARGGSSEAPLLLSLEIRNQKGEVTTSGRVEVV